MVNKTDSIYFRLIKLLFLAASVAGISYWSMRTAGNSAIDHFFVYSDYINRQSEKRAGELQKYIDEEKLTFQDTEELSNWVKAHSFVEMQIYKNNSLIYDSFSANIEETEDMDFEETEIGYAETEETEETAGMAAYEGEPFYRISFADGEGIVFLYDFYVYQFYTYVLIGNLLVSFLIFLVIVMLGIRRIMNYILCLSREIGILESGDLDYSITVKGKDELALLAKGLDDMRKSFQRQTEQEVQIMQANQRMIAEMSHDLRTPLTALLIYTGILKNRKYSDERQMREYIDKADKKAHQMKQLSDHIFEYALICQETKINLEEPESFQEVFFDLLSECTAYLEQNGFHIKFQPRRVNGRVRISSEYVNRILDNLMSNIIKYADPCAPVKISLSRMEQYGCVSFENQKKHKTHEEESTNIGLQNIKKMMRKMEGRCETDEGEHSFKTQLFFRIFS